MLPRVSRTGRVVPPGVRSEAVAVGESISDGTETAAEVAVFPPTAITVQDDLLAPVPVAETAAGDIDPVTPERLETTMFPATAVETPESIDAPETAWLGFNDAPDGFILLPSERPTDKAL